MGLLLETLRHSHIKDFGAVIFRRTTPQITNKGGLWDESQKLYPLIGAVPKESTREWTYPSGAGVKFSHLEYDKDALGFQGAQIPFIGFDEVTHFTEFQFWYLFSRNRSVCGVKPYMRATCNPDPDSFVAKLIAWWIDQSTGFAIPERSGVLRWFVRENDEVIWADTRQELIDSDPHKGDPLLGRRPTSLTFIASTVYDNKILLAKDPSYLAKLMALPNVEQQRLLGGNWKIKPAAGTMFRKEWFEIVDAAPAGLTRVRYWDRAGTAPPAPGQALPTGAKDPDWTVGEEQGVSPKNVFYIMDVVRFRGTPLTVESAIQNTASRDGVECHIGLEQDPGQAGKMEAGYHVRQLAGYKVEAVPVHKDKVQRASPFSAQCQAGNVKLVRGAWNEAFLNELENFPDGEHDDQVDASSGAFTMLTKIKKRVNVS